MNCRREDIGAAALYLGDCLEVLPTLSRVDAIVADPPYAIPTQVASGRSQVCNVGDLSLIEAAFRQFFEAVLVSLAPSGRCFVFCDGTSYPVIFRASYGLFSSALLVWDKGRPGMGREFRKSHELILHLWREATPVHDDTILRLDVMRFDPVPVADRRHDAEKPVALLSHLIALCGDRVCDPFMGSGSTGEAAIRSGRRFVGIEIEAAYYERALQRLRDIEAAPELPFFDTEGLAAAP